MNPDYIESLQDRFGPRYDAIFRFAILLQSTLESQSELFELSDQEKLAIIGLAGHIMKNEHIRQAIDETEELLGEHDDEDGDWDDGDDDIELRE